MGIISSHIRAGWRKDWLDICLRHTTHKRHMQYALGGLLFGHVSASSVTNSFHIYLHPLCAPANVSHTLFLPSAHPPLNPQRKNVSYHFPTHVPPTTFFPPRSHHRCRTPTSAWRDARRRRARVPHAARGSLRCRPTVQSCQQRLSCLKDALPRMELWSRRPRPLLFLLRQPTRKAKRELHRRHGVASTLRSLRSLYPRLRLQGRRIQ